MSDLSLLHHALGINDPMHPEREPYRNHFVADEGHDDIPALERLESRGLMERSNPPDFCGGWVFTVTEAGKAKALQTRPRAPQAKRRYHRFLELQDVMPDLTFREFLSMPEAKDEQSRA